MNIPVEGHGFLDLNILNIIERIREGVVEYGGYGCRVIVRIRIVIAELVENLASPVVRTDLEIRNPSRAVRVEQDVKNPVTGQRIASY